jgi:hypothetical protein
MDPVVVSLLVVFGIGVVVMVAMAFERRRGP